MGLVADVQYCWAGERLYEECTGSRYFTEVGFLSPKVLGSIVSFLIHNSIEMDGEEELMWLWTTK